MPTCEKCGKNHEGTYASGRFCSSFCSHSKIVSVETRNKISKSLKKIHKPKKCLVCPREFIKKSQSCCSRSCAMVLRHRRNPSLARMAGIMGGIKSKGRKGNRKKDNGKSSHHDKRIVIRIPDNTNEKFSCDIVLPYNTYTRAKYASRMRKFRYDVKIGKKCEQCSEDNINLLDLAHYNRKDKKCSLRSSYSMETLKKEIKKGRFLCVWCHRLETKKENIKIKKENLKLWISAENDDLNMDPDSKMCHGLLCNGKMRHSTFLYRRKSNGKTYTPCKRCISYRSRKKYEKYALFVTGQKLKIGECKLCKIKVRKETSSCFDFDHINPEDKIKTISQMAMHKEDAILKEMKKCRLLCCKCHRLHTLKQLNHVDYSNYDYAKELEDLKVKYSENMVLIYPPGPPPKLNIIRM